MSTDLESLRAECAAQQAKLKDLADRVDAAIAAARKVKKEPPQVSDADLLYISEDNGYVDRSIRAARRLRWCEGELARLREGLKGQSCDATDGQVAHYTKPGIYNVELERMAREIQRHRALLKDGGGK